MVFDSKQEIAASGRPDVKEEWRYFAALYVLDALENGHTILCERCKGLDLGQRLKKRELFTEYSDYVSGNCLTGTWKKNIFQIEVDRAVMDLEEALVDAKYVALSYVWGTTKASPLPRTIQDAKVIAATLGYTYLWVDQLCINQISSHKMSQIHQMDRIYYNANLTIIAMAGDNANYGIPGITATPRLSQKFAKFGDHIILQPSQDFTAIKSRSGLTGHASRAWTFQEEMLSRRRLYFSDDMAWFKCCDIDRSFAALETLPRPGFEKFHREGWVVKLSPDIHSDTECIHRNSSGVRENGTGENAARLRLWHLLSLSSD
ncbi:hypothetical protein PT974_02417 [Cladobotryum mycophilum]|uniref:Heterokaryon incompatibility domain-containing protein n=1 Tax=Cladobotryum mycophilum TaxID=491253 RepID=A0ABR0SZA7_9HYPO